VWSHQSVLHRKAFKLSAVRPTITSGGDTSVLISKATLTNPHKRLSFLMSDASVIFTAFAERTRNITDILQKKYLTEKKLWPFHQSHLFFCHCIHAIQQITTIKIKNNCYVLRWNKEHKMWVGNLWALKVFYDAFVWRVIKNFSFCYFFWDCSCLLFFMGYVISRSKFNLIWMRKNWIMHKHESFKSVFNSVVVWAILPIIDIKIKRM